MKREPIQWEAIAARVVRETTPAGEGPPFGFATRVVGLWREAQRDEALRRWSFWSLRAALASAAVCALVVFFGSREEESPILVSPPSAEFLAPPFSSQ